MTATAVVYRSATVARPATIKMTMMSSESMWPKVTRGPIVQPADIEALMVATSVGPGARAPVRPDDKGQKDKHLERIEHEYREWPRGMPLK